MKFASALFVLILSLCFSPIFGQTFLSGTRSKVSIDTIGNNVALLQWSGGGDTTMLQYRSLKAGVTKNVAVTGNHYVLNGLPDGALYEWRVKDQNSGIASPINKFRTYTKVLPNEDSVAVSGEYMLLPKPKEYLQVHKIYENYLNISCSRKFSKEKYSLATLYNWEREEVARLAFDLNKQVNNYLIDLFSLGINWELDVTYTLEFDRGFRPSDYIQFSLNLPPEKLAPQLEIVPNPLEISCDDISIFEFYGNINGGKPPYDVLWAVMGENEELLTAPVEVHLEERDDVPKITVEEKMGFTVVLAVEDACGSFEEIELKLNCEDDELTDTIFLEPTDRLKETRTANTEIPND